MFNRSLQVSILCILGVFSAALTLGGCGGATGGAAGGALWGAASQLSDSTKETPITPVQPYQAGDDNLSCADLNKEIGRAQERMSRLMEQNEKKELETEQRHSLGNHLQQFGIMSIMTYPISSAFHSMSKTDKEQFGTEDTRIVQTYQERVKHLESLAKSKGCS